MIEVVDQLVAWITSDGLLYGGAGGVISLGLWLRRARKLVVWIRVGSVLLVVLGVGALAGVVDLGQLVDLLTSAYELVLATGWSA